RRRCRGDRAARVLHLADRLPPRGARGGVAARERSGGHAAGRRAPARGGDRRLDAHRRRRRGLQPVPPGRARRHRAPARQGPADHVGERLLRPGLGRRRGRDGRGPRGDRGVLGAHPQSDRASDARPRRPGADWHALVDRAGQLGSCRTRVGDRGAAQPAALGDRSGRARASARGAGRAGVPLWRVHHAAGAHPGTSRDRALPHTLRGGYADRRLRRPHAGVAVDRRGAGCGGGGRRAGRAAAADADRLPVLDAAFAVGDPRLLVAAERRRHPLLPRHRPGGGAGRGTYPGRGREVTTMTVQIETGDGLAEAWVARPEDTERALPGVLLFMDAFGLRPQIREMAQRIADGGYVVLAPNVFHRSGSVEEIAPTADLREPEGRDRALEQAIPRMNELTPGLSRADTTRYLEALAELPGVAGDAPVGVIGYCMGARLALRAGGD